jgi:hypothetical protein
MFVSMFVCLFVVNEYRFNDSAIDVKTFLAVFNEDAKLDFPPMKMYFLFNDSPRENFQQLSTPHLDSDNVLPFMCVFGACRR